MSDTATYFPRPGQPATGVAPKVISPLFPYLIGGLLHDANNYLTVLLLSSDADLAIPGETNEDLTAQNQAHSSLLHVAKVLKIIQNMARDYYGTGAQTRSGIESRLTELVEKKRKNSPNIGITLVCLGPLEESDLPASLVLFLADELLQNAIKACGKETKHEVELKLAADSDANTVSLCIVDDGPGFTPEKLVAIRNCLVPPPVDGTQGGYGLYFVNEIALRLRGRLLAANLTPGARVEVLMPFYSPIHL